MMSNNRASFGSASEWLSTLRQDESWLSQLQRLQAPADSSISVSRDELLEQIGQGDTLFLWNIYQHKVEPVVTEVWEIAELSLVKLKIQTIGMLSIEWLEQHASTDGVPSDKASDKAKKSAPKKKAAMPQKHRETMTFGRKKGLMEGHITLLYNILFEEGWIDGAEAHFKALFSGQQDDDCELTWKGKFGKATLVDLFKQLTGEGLTLVPQGYTLAAILEGHFKDLEGQWLTGLDKGNHGNMKALPVIQKCVKLLKTDPQRLINGDYDDDEDFRSEYDPYDHQDLRYHKGR
jgi:hypothetical protein